MNAPEKNDSVLATVNRFKTPIHLLALLYSVAMGIAGMWWSLQKSVDSQAIAIAEMSRDMSSLSGTAGRLDRQIEKTYPRFEAERENATFRARLDDHELRIRSVETRKL